MAHTDSIVRHSFRMHLDHPLDDPAFHWIDGHEEDTQRPFFKAVGLHPADADLLRERLTAYGITATIDDQGETGKSSVTLVGPIDVAVFESRKTRAEWSRRVIVQAMEGITNDAQGKSVFLNPLKLSPGDLERGRLMLEGALRTVQLQPDTLFPQYKRDGFFGRGELSTVFYQFDEPKKIRQLEQIYTLGTQEKPAGRTV